MMMNSVTQETKVSKILGFILLFLGPLSGCFSQGGGTEKPASHSSPEKAGEQNPQGVSQGSSSNKGSFSLSPPLQKAFSQARNAYRTFLQTEIETEKRKHQEKALPLLKDPGNYDEACTLEKKIRAQTEKTRSLEEKLPACFETFVRGLEKQPPTECLDQPVLKQTFEKVYTWLSATSPSPPVQNMKEICGEDLFKGLEYLHNPQQWNQKNDASFGVMLEPVKPAKPALKSYLKFFERPLNDLYGSQELYFPFTPAKIREKSHLTQETSPENLQQSITYSFGRDFLELLDPVQAQKTTEQQLSSLLIEGKKNYQFPSLELIEFNLKKQEILQEEDLRRWDWTSLSMGDRESLKSSFSIQLGLALDPDESDASSSDKSTKELNSLLGQLVQKGRIEP